MIRLPLSFDLGGRYDRTRVHQEACGCRFVTNVEEATRRQADSSPLVTGLMCVPIANTAVCRFMLLSRSARDTSRVSSGRTLRWRMANGEWRVSLEEREATTSASSSSRSTSVEASVAVGLMAVIEGAASTMQSAS